MLSLSFLKVVNITNSIAYNVIGLFGIWKSPLCLCFQLFYLFIYYFFCVYGTWVMSQCCNCVFSSSGCMHIYMYFNIYVRWHGKGMLQVPHWGEKNKKWEKYFYIHAPSTTYSIQSYQLPDLGRWGTGMMCLGDVGLEKNLTSLPRKIEVCPFSWFSFCFNNKYFLSIGEGWSA